MVPAEEGPETGSEGRCQRSGCRGPDGHPNPTPRALCEPCRALLDRTLDGFPRWYVQLGQELPKGSSGGEIVSGTREPPLPLNFGILALQDDLARLVRECETVVRRVQAHTPPVETLSQGLQVYTGVIYLRTHLSVLVALPDAVEWTERILRLHRQIERRIGDGKVFHRLPAPCPACDSLALVREDGAETVECRHCFESMSVEVYAHFVHELAKTHSEKGHS